MYRNNMNIKTYKACTDCATYICTGDSSHMSLNTHYEETIINIDATQGALQADDNIAYWLESVAETDCSMERCTFCGCDDTINKQVQGLVK